jgi:TolA-binding protein
MNERSRNINGKPGSVKNNRASNWFDDNSLLNSEDMNMFDTMGEYIRGKQDIEDVKNDPALSNTDKAVREMITDYRKNISGNRENENFIRGIFAEAAPEKKTNDEISNIKKEVKDNHLNEITVEWVKEWHEKRQRNGRNPETEEIKNFINTSLKPEESEPVKYLTADNKQGISRSLIVRYASLSAAAVIGVFFLIKMLLPSSDTEKLYTSYYQPFNAVSSVTRSAISDETDLYSTSLEQYRLGDYQTAAIGFSAVILRDTSIIAPRFLMGMSQMGMGNFDQAVNLLSPISVRSGEYHKEAVWYLGLAYLKTGEKKKAAECFALLTKSPGYYNERAGKILRRLK